MTTSAPWSKVQFYNGPLRVREADAGVTDSDLDQFRRLTGDGDRPDALDPGTFERFQRLSIWLYYQNPFARRLCDLPTDMILGAGVNVDAEPGEIEQDVRAVKQEVKRFLDHPANEFDIRLPGLFTMLNIVTGELFLPVFVSPQNGDVGLGYLEHHLVQDVLFNPNNRMEAVAIIQRSPAPGKKPLFWNVVRASQGEKSSMFPQHPVFDKAVGDRRDIVVKDEDAEDTAVAKVPQEFDYAGEIFYFRTNVLGPGRGRSALEPTLDWLHAYDNFLFGDLRNANMQAAFVWDVTIEGADIADLKDKANELKANPPRPGEVNIHNEKESWDAISPKLNAADHTQLGVQVKKVIGLAVGLPPHLIAAEDNTNRTSSNSADIPFLRRMEQRQRLLNYLVRTILDYMLDQKVYAGALVAKRPYPYKTVLPNLSAGELVAMAEGLYNVTESVNSAVDKGITSLEDARRIWYSYGLQETSVPDGLQERIDQERADGLTIDPVEQAEKEMEQKKDKFSDNGLAGKSGAPKRPGTVGGRVKRAKTTSGGPRAAQRGG